MIDFLTSWVKVIIFVVLFATFLEFLLPNNSMQRFVKVILGLFIMLTILNPIADMLHRGWGINDITTIAPKISGTSLMLQEEKNVIRERERLTLEIYKADVAKQAKALVMAIGGVGDVNIGVHLAEKTGDKPESGKIAKLEVYVQPGFDREIGKIRKIEVEKPPSKIQPAIPPELISRIKKTLGEFYQLRHEQIEVSAI